LRNLVILRLPGVLCGAGYNLEQRPEEAKVSVA
jgi:hypothetical protein